ICNHSDDRGRYAYRAQPRVAQWNLYALADAMLTLIGHPDVAKAAVDEAFSAAYDAAFIRAMRAKLGLAAELPGDEDFIGATFGFLQQHRPDYTLFFRRLSGLPAQVGETERARTDAPLRDLFIDRDACDAWLRDWRARLAQEDSRDGTRQAAMRATNPKYILRNWVAESAIQKAKQKDFSELAAVLACLRRPFDEQPEYERFAALPPDWANGLSVSCSS
ncbi:MAG: hypothetical protein HGA47_10360, partial [Zoogloea sp.]|nr:hypothetical protein [Zoogloea sp.]